ncbi:tRNA (adenosine(37)-N6)-threonylcarbamoyltransferase complex ATPase subunit type 1 TsaE [Candidatus Mycosynbacter amalyticus]|uniref:tRNA threonylcarbamoyladenosine biosynthesis protein TsaE n=1 Tax=Candidatus Mycosynbacter amalyticus TaxID=2665156 RepID=A0A857MM16_9BACT|nr:tRNA (adenosine(37)-N6)-threonylcarbamoyltransferase complex ATPase subunit type 1 TsaE [Candidatus Mycosynbacter amalyticus]QHN43148.1 tRNA (adenosine(37)-N6)-threonylcarbamoyltransferase complex ATPase subunit type 1 TsaE [Candidatus Mycosynbacter amalyticus]
MIVSSLGEMLTFGERVARNLHGGEVLELVGDVGAGKTTFTKGLARGLGVHDAVQSPTFAISREYDGERGLHLVHYDFYRLDNAGIMADELAESLADEHGVTVVEWAETVASILPTDRVTLTIRLVADDEQARDVSWTTGGERSKELMEAST